MLFWSKLCKNSCLLPKQHFYFLSKESNSKNRTKIRSVLNIANICTRGPQSLSSLRAWRDHDPALARHSQLSKNFANNSPPRSWLPVPWLPLPRAKSVIGCLIFRLWWARGSSVQEDGHRMYRQTVFHEQLYTYWQRNIGAFFNAVNYVKLTTVRVMQVNSLYRSLKISDINTPEYCCQLVIPNSLVYVI